MDPGLCRVVKNERYPLAEMECAAAKGASTPSDSPLKWGEMGLIASELVRIATDSEYENNFSILNL